MPQLRAGGPAQALVASPDQRMAAELKHLLGREIPQLQLVMRSEYPTRSSLAELTNQGGIQLCFLDIASDRDASAAAMALVSAYYPGVPLFALLRANDPDLILQCLRQGASEFLIQPFTTEQLQAALAKLSRFHQTRPAQPGSNCRVFCVLPGKGACGATTVACHLAHSLQRHGLPKVLLADMDGYTGTVAFLLKLKSGYSFIDALQHSGNLEADIWKALVTPTCGIDVLLAPENPMDGAGNDADPTPIVSYARNVYDAVVLDAGSPYGEWNAALARAADEVLIVTTGELAALHSFQRARAYLESKGANGDNIRLVINRHAKNQGLDREAIEQALHCEIYNTLPADPDAVLRSLMDGRPVPANSSFGKSVAHLAAALAGQNGNGKVHHATGLGGFFKKLMG
jgi:pilus assembly protein CpaE